MIIEPKFAPVADKFFELSSAQPYGGASLAIYQDGQPMLDIWAGEARPGELWYEKVATYWPEFAQSGKESMTLAMIM